MHLTAGNDNETKLFSCRFCERTFTRKNSLEGHERVHTGERPFTCKYCQDTFTLKSTKNNHEKSHFRKNFSCKNCQKVFHSYSDKKEHEKTHTEKKPYSCKECKRSYGRLDTLRAHERIHTGKILSCPLCPRIFTMENQVNNHICSKKNFKCNVCHKVYTTLEALNKHEHWKSMADISKESNTEIAFSCKFCPQKFVKKREFKNHEKMHLKKTLLKQEIIQPQKSLFHCSYCRKGYKTSGPLRKHEEFCASIKNSEAYENVKSEDGLKLLTIDGKVYQVENNRLIPLSVM